MISQPFAGFLSQSAKPSLQLAIVQALPAQPAMPFAIEKAAERSLYVRPINPSAKWAADLALHNAIAAHARWKVAPIPGER